MRNNAINDIINNNVINNDHGDVSLESKILSDLAENILLNVLQNPKLNIKFVATSLLP